MRKKWRWLLLALTGIFFLMFGPPLVSQARNVIEATGNDVKTYSSSSSCTATDQFIEACCQST
ncbi:hypothetical protein WP50_18345 [Lactiplantibacillus plantarum]|nr:hypothetical protein WP50_18345 [Lactiplantibacillus plantarum]